MCSGTSQTGSTLFALLEHPGDSQAWGKFVDRYGPRVFHWCRAKGLQAVDAEDVTQEVLTKFAKSIRNFAYDPAKSGFRAWLRTVTKNSLCDVRNDLRRNQASGDPRALALLDSIEAANDLNQDLDELFERELLEKAMSIVRIRVEPNTWRAFELLVIDGQAGKEVAKQLGITVAAVYMAKSRVKGMLETQVRRLEGSP